MALERFTFVAHTIRTLVFSTSDEPTRRYSPFSKTRNRRACVGRGNSATSSRNIVPPLASLKYPLRSLTAPVKAPLTCPKSSESMVPSGMAPQFTAMYLPCLRTLFVCIIFGKNSLPTPLSPVMSTVRSVLATCIAVSIALNSPGSFPMIPNCCWALLTSVISIAISIS